MIFYANSITYKECRSLLNFLYSYAFDVHAWTVCGLVSGNNLQDASLLVSQFREVI